MGGTGGETGKPPPDFDLAIDNSNCLTIFGEHGASIAAHGCWSWMSKSHNICVDKSCALILKVATVDKKKSETAIVHTVRVQATGVKFLHCRQKIPCANFHSTHTFTCTLYPNFSIVSGICYACHGARVIQYEKET